MQTDSLASFSYQTEDALWFKRSTKTKGSNMAFKINLALRTSTPLNLNLTTNLEATANPVTIPRLTSTPADDIWC